MRARNKNKIVSIALLCVATMMCPAIGAQPVTLTWEQAISQALTFHPSISSATKAEEAAQRALQRASAAYAPQLTLSSKPASTGNRQDSGGQFHRYTESEARLTAGLTTSFGTSGSVALGYTWSQKQQQGRSFLTLAGNASLDPKGRLYSNTRLALEKARNTAQKASWDRQEQAQTTALSVLSTFWRLELDAQRLAITREGRQRQADIYARELERKRLGLATDLDVLEAEIEWCQAEVAEQKAEAEYRTRLLTLASDLELPPEIALAPSEASLRTNSWITLIGRPWSRRCVNIA